MPASSLRPAGFTAPAAEPLRSIDARSFPEILAELSISPAYQAGMRMALRADGDVLNTHFRLLHGQPGIRLDFVPRSLMPWLRIF